MLYEMRTYTAMPGRMPDLHKRFTEVVRIEKLLLSSGSGTETDYLNAEADLLGARANLARASHAEIAARAELARAGGQLDAAWIDRALEVRP